MRSGTAGPIRIRSCIARQFMRCRSCFGRRYKRPESLQTLAVTPPAWALGLAPRSAGRVIEPQGIVIDSKSGVTGSGRSPSETAHFPNCNEAFSPYKIAAHRHTPEIEQTLSSVAGEKLQVVFVPHLLPLNRGIISTMYARLKEGVTPSEAARGLPKCLSR